MGPLVVTKEQVAEIENAHPIWMRLIWRGMWHVWVAPPNAGKTAVANKAAADMARDGLEVIYVNVDASASDLKHYQALATAGKFTLVSTFAQGSSVADIVAAIDAMAKEEDLSRVVLILDTLKKFADLMSKKASKGFYDKLRSLTQRGCTVITLAHTNKFKAEDGSYVYEGTGDLRSDTDIMMFLYPLPDESKNITISTKFEKDRAYVEDVTFFYERATRRVTVESEYVDTQSEAAIRAKESEDEMLIQFIKSILPANQTQIVAAVRAKHLCGLHPVKRVLNAYRGRHWDTERAMNNETRYRIRA